MVFVFLTQKTLEITLGIYPILIYTLIAIGLLTVWLALKKVLLIQKQLKEDNFKLKRFSRNYEVFKNNLIKSKKIDLSENNPIILGNKESNLTISFVTSPYCGHCKEAHEVIDRIIKKYSDVKVCMYLSIDVANRGSEEVDLYRKLIHNYLQHGGEKLSEFMIEIHQTKNYQLFKDLVLTNTEEVDKVLADQYDFCKKGNIHYTPAIFINGYDYPPAYDRKELEFFITELIEDETL
jgi:protein-disulfide isomerase